MLQFSITSSLKLLDRMNRALSHDFCPGANRFVYWLKNPFWVLVLAVALSVVCGVFLSPGAFIITGILLALTALGVALPWIAMRGIEASVTFDVRRGRVGQPAMIRLSVRNRWPWPVWGLSLVRGFALCDSRDTEEGVSLARVAGWSATEFTWAFVPRIRGRYPLVSPKIETGFPFGLYRATRRVEVNGQLIAWPATVELHGLPDAADLRSDSDSMSDRRAGDCGDILGTRAFREGDSLRRVHWAQTARQQQLIVTERQSVATALVRVVLDLDPGSHPDCDDQQRRLDDSLELSVLTAASIAESLHRQHCRVELQLGDRLVVAEQSAASFQNLMDQLSQARVSDSSARLKLGTRSASFVIAVTTPTGMRWRSGQLQGAHVVSVAETVSGLRHHDVAAAWIELTGLADVRSELSRQWKGACNAR